jgi:hypothetical protein
MSEYTQRGDRRFRNNSVPLGRPSVCLSIAPRQPTVTLQIPANNKQHLDCNQSNIINVVVDFKFIGSSGVCSALAYLSSHAFLILVYSRRYSHSVSQELCSARWPYEI